MNNLADLIEYCKKANLELRVHLNPHLGEEEPLNIYEAVGHMVSTGEISKDTAAECIKENFIVKLLVYSTPESVQYDFAIGTNVEDCAATLLKELKVIK